MRTNKNIANVLPELEGVGQIWMINEHDLFEILQEHGRKYYGEKFTLWKEDYHAIRKLLIYFCGDYALASKNSIDLKKGVILSGSVGCGKTSLMQLVNIFAGPERGHKVKPCREIAFEFLSEGFEIITKYSKKAFLKSGQQWTPEIYCFDDLGQEMKMKYYGNECEVMREIILSRYEMFEAFGMLTHFTTNLSEKQISMRYGKNVASRLSAMCNFMSFEHSFDKRRK